MKITPLLFNTDMVRALLDGRKTQTRRIVKPQPYLNPNGCGRHLWDCKAVRSTVSAEHVLMEQEKGWEGFAASICPYGQPGDLIYVRETFCYHGIGQPGISYKGDPHPWGVKPDPLPWKPSIHMPRKFSRLTLLITHIRVERVQDISGQDAWQEGVTADKVTQSPWVGVCAPATAHAFAALWNSINNNWDENPWVWVIEFEVIHQNVDAYLKAVAA